MHIVISISWQQKDYNKFLLTFSSSNTQHRAPAVFLGWQYETHFPVFQLSRCCWSYLSWKIECCLLFNSEWKMWLHSWWLDVFLVHGWKSMEDRILFFCFNNPYWRHWYLIVLTFVKNLQDRKIVDNDFEKNMKQYKSSTIFLVNYLHNVSQKNDVVFTHYYLGSCFNLLQRKRSIDRPVLCYYALHWASLCARIGHIR